MALEKQKYRLVREQMGRPGIIDLASGNGAATKSRLTLDMSSNGRPRLSNSGAPVGNQNYTSPKSSLEAGQSSSSYRQKQSNRPPHKASMEGRYSLSLPLQSIQEETQYNEYSRPSTVVKRKPSVKHFNQIIPPPTTTQLLSGSKSLKINTSLPADTQQNLSPATLSSNNPFLREVNTGTETSSSQIPNSIHQNDTYLKKANTEGVKLMRSMSLAASVSPANSSLSGKPLSNSVPSSPNRPTSSHPSSPSTPSQLSVQH